MKERLVIDNEGENWFLVWYFPDDGEYGAVVGEARRQLPTLAQLEKEIAKAQSEELAIEAAIISAFADTDEIYISRRGFAFACQSSARKALRVAKIAAETYNASRPWPDWAIKAAAEGWRRPKGWKP
jgi:hypothetical protein